MPCGRFRNARPEAEALVPSGLNGAGLELSLRGQDNWLAWSLFGQKAHYSNVEIVRVVAFEQSTDGLIEIAIGVATIGHPL